VKDGKLIANPTFVELDEGQLDIVVAGSDDAILMVEGGAKEISEAVLLEALDFAHAQIKQLNAFQREFLAACAPKAKRSFAKLEINKELEAKLRADYLAEIGRLARLGGKLCRQNALSEIRAAAERDRRSLTQEIIHLLEAGLRGRPKTNLRPDVTAQVAAWRALAGQWASDVDAATEASRIAAARSRGSSAAMPP